MEFNWEKFSGVFLFWVGILIFINNFTGITGYTIYNELAKIKDSFAGIILIFVGIFIFVVAERQERESPLVRIKIVETTHFQKAAKKHLAEAREAATKIGTGKGKEEKLRGREGYSIRARSGDRIVFVYDREHKIATLTDYVRGDDYGN